MLKANFPDALIVDLLDPDSYRTYVGRPEQLRALVEGNPGISRLVIDEIQKVPSLLDEVHWLIENTNYVFGLCGSSARKVRRGHANLLGARASQRYSLLYIAAGQRDSPDQALVLVVRCLVELPMAETKS